MNFKDFLTATGQFNFLSVGRAVFMGIASKWYFIIAIPACNITYKIYKKLEEKGLVDAFITEVQKNLVVIEFMVDQCMDHILEFEKFYSCIGSF
jgi:hypothetical protein